MNKLKLIFHHIVALQNYRARYESERCRGPIHGSKDNTFPTVQVKWLEARYTKCCLLSHACSCSSGELTLEMSPNTSIFQVDLPFFFFASFCCSGGWIFRTSMDYHSSCYQWWHPSLPFHSWPRFYKGSLQRVYAPRWGPCSASDGGIWFQHDSSVSFIHSCSKVHVRYWGEACKETADHYM